MEQNNQDKQLEFGVQPLDAIMEDFSFKNSDLVQASEEQLTHKIVRKARNGRKISTKLQRKVLNALNARVLYMEPEAQSYTLNQLFNYR